MTDIPYPHSLMMPLAVSPSGIWHVFRLRIFLGVIAPVAYTCACAYICEGRAHERMSEDAASTTIMVFFEPGLWPRLIDITGG